MLAYPSVILLSAAGFAIAFYIYRKKSKKEKLICNILDSDCDQVVKSQYGQLLGIPNEVMGMAYYLLLIVSVILLMSGVTAIFNFSLTNLIFIVSGLAAVVSIILIYIQAIILKNWCEYCLASSLINIIIFILEIL